MPRPQPKDSGLLPAVREVVSEVSRIEKMLVDDEWLSGDWVGIVGPRFQTTKEAMVLMWQSWQSLVAAVRPRNGEHQPDHSHFRNACLTLSATALKIAVDVPVMDGLANETVRIAQEEEDD